MGSKVIRRIIARRLGGGRGEGAMKMQHEVLLALAGCPGNLFSVSRQSGLLEVSCTWYVCSTRTRTHVLLCACTVVLSRI